MNLLPLENVASVDTLDAIGKLLANYQKQNKSEVGKELAVLKAKELSNNDRKVIEAMESLMSRNHQFQPTTMPRDIKTEIHYFELFKAKVEYNKQDLAYQQQRLGECQAQLKKLNSSRG